MFDSLRLPYFLRATRVKLAEAERVQALKFTTYSRPGGMNRRCLDLYQALVDLG